MSLELVGYCDDDEDVRRLLRSSCPRTRTVVTGKHESELRAIAVAHQAQARDVCRICKQPRRRGWTLSPVQP